MKDYANFLLVSVALLTGLGVVWAAEKIDSGLENVQAPYYQNIYCVGVGMDFLHCASAA